MTHIPLKLQFSLMLIFLQGILLFTPPFKLKFPPSLHHIIRYLHSIINPWFTKRRLLVFHLLLFQPAKSYPTSFPQNLSNFIVASPYKTLGLTFSMMPKSSCAGDGSGVFLSVSYFISSSLKSLISLRIIPPGTSTRKKIMKVAYGSPTNSIQFFAEDKNGVQTIYDAELVSHLLQSLL